MSKVHTNAEVVALGEKCIVSDLACLLSIHWHNTMHGSKAPFYPCSITTGADVHDFIFLVSFTDIYILRNNLANVLRTIKNCKHVCSSQNHWTTVQKLQTACILWKPHFCRTWRSIIAGIARIQRSIVHHILDYAMVENSFCFLWSKSRIDILFIPTAMWLLSLLWLKKLTRSCPSALTQQYHVTTVQ